MLSGGIQNATLIDDNAYVETSATCGFAYGILRAVHLGSQAEGIQYIEEI